MNQPSNIMDLSSVPEGVDPHLAHNRNLIVERFRQGHVSAEIALRALTSLYWDHQDSASAETRFYLADAAVEFPLEADMDENEAFTIWEAGQRNS